MQVMLLICGIFGGVLGGMGMGGGTLLIPLLTGFCNLSQHAAQAINLIAFIPMSVIALLIHAKNGYVKWRTVWPMMITACLFGAAFSFVAQRLDAGILRFSFGILLCVLGGLLLIKEIVQKIKLRSQFTINN